MLRVIAEPLGAMGTGSNMFRTGLAHSSGHVFIGTYGPPPAIIWRYDPHAGELQRVGAPGEYQLDSMVEAPNGKVYIGTAYNGLVYELDPATGSVRDLGSPPVDSTPWIFTMIRTRVGEIYGAKGVGLFHLDWRTGRMEACGVVPGDHRTPGPSASSPIIRTLEERPDGILWGDTNRWIFTFDPRTRQITPVADIAALDDACYGVIHGLGASPVPDLYFQVYSRFDGRVPRHHFGVCRADTGAVEWLDFPELEGQLWLTGWWVSSGEPRLLVSEYDERESRARLAVVDAARRRVVARWAVEGNDVPPQRLAGEGLWFISSARGSLFRADPEQQRLVAVARNPVPVECRCLAAAPDGLLGTDTYDCGFAFTFDPRSGRHQDHGRVWLDDHRCNHGPAAFAGSAGRTLLANHGGATPTLWATDCLTNRHWRVGGPAVQLVRFTDGTVWGTQGANPPSIHFDPATCWTPAWAARPGALFRYRDGAGEVEVFPEAGPTGCLAEAPGEQGHLLLAAGDILRRFDPEARRVVAEATLPAPIIALAAAARAAYLVLADGSVFRLTGAEMAPRRCARGFGPVARGCFVLPRSGRLVGLAADGTVSCCDPDTGAVQRVDGPVPLPAGPAVDPEEDAWYFAGREVVRYWIAREPAEA